MSNPKARANWDRYQYGKNRGHIDYMKQADRCEQMYLGGGRQWKPEDRAYVEAQKRPALEFNEIKGAVNTAIGYQIQNRMDIAFKPRVVRRTWPRPRSCPRWPCKCQTSADCTGRKHRCSAMG